MLTGRVPFDAQTPIAVALQHMEAPPPPARSLRPDLTPAVEAVLARALAKQPQDRYPTGAALAAALAEAAGPDGAVGAEAAPLATLLSAVAADEARGDDARRATLPTRPAGWDQALRRGSRAPILQPADVLLLVVLAVAVLGGLLWNWSTTATVFSWTGFEPVAGAGETLPPPPADSPTAAPPTAQAVSGTSLPAPTLGPATPWWQTPTATRRVPVFVPPPATPTPEPVVESGPGDPPAEPTTAPPTDQPPPPPPPTEAPPLPTEQPPVPTGTSVPPSTNTAPPPPTNTAELPPTTNTAPPPAPTSTPVPDELLDITICHHPPGNPRNVETMTVRPDELAGHLAHGDTLGPCP
jgi:serine/threonine-protein kinase